MKKSHFAGQGAEISNLSSNQDDRNAHKADAFESKNIHNQASPVRLDALAELNLPELIKQMQMSSKTPVMTG